MNPTRQRSTSSFGNFRSSPRSVSWGAQKPLSAVEREWLAQRLLLWVTDGSYPLYEAIVLLVSVLGIGIGFSDEALSIHVSLRLMNFCSSRPMNVVEPQESLQKFLSSLDLVRTTTVSVLGLYDVSFHSSRRCSEIALIEGTANQCSDVDSS